MEPHPQHNDIIKFLEDNLDNKGIVVLSPGVMIMDVSKYCKSQLELIRGTKSERQYKLVVFHVKQLKKVLKPKK